MWRRTLAMCSLIFAGEAIFLLPFVLPRVFRPTLLDVFQINNTELGVAFSVYGMIAMGAYFFGGPIADAIAARKLMVAALVATAAAGIVLASVPSLGTIKVLYGYWGLTTILLFWSPLLRATRQWGGESLPGRAFGFLDGGRGAISALVGSVSVFVFASFLPTDVESASLQERTVAFQRVIWIFTGVTVAAAVMVWFGLGSEPNASTAQRRVFSPRAVLRVVRMPTVWLHSVIVISAYAGFKSLDDVSLFARDALGFNEVDAAETSTISLWVRAPAAVAAGFLADRFGVAKTTTWSFVLVAISSAVIASGALGPSVIVFSMSTIITTSAALFALRGIYFALLGEGHVPIAQTGTAIGVVSVLGFTPDVFMGPLMGLLLDRSPGELGHQHVFAVVTAFAILGLIASIAFSIVASRQQVER